MAKTVPKWVHDCLDTFEFHDKKIKEEGQSPPGRPWRDSKKGWSVRDTARELKISVACCSDRIILARALKRNKSLAYHSYKYSLRLARKLNGNS